jgi:DNA modification methylase
MTVRLLRGDCRQILASLPSASVHCCVTSPPYFGLRDYGTVEWDGGDPEHEHDRVLARGGRGGSGSPGKQTVGAFPSDVPAAECSCGARRVDRQIGLEATPEAFVAELVAVFREVRRVLRDDGTLWLNLGDSYAANRGYQVPSTLMNGSATNAAQAGSGRGIMASAFGLKAKDLIGIPWRVAFALQQPYYTGRIKDERDRIWLAAIIDGEGCFFIHKRKAGTPSYAKFTRADGSEVNYERTADTFGVGLEICNTQKAIIDRVQEIVGGGTVTTQSPQQNARRKQTIYRWRVAPNEAKRLAQELYPHLVGKRHQARLIFNCPSTGEAGALAHQAMMDLHNGVETSIDYPAPPTLFEPGWYLRQEIIWAKKNCMPESVTDRCTKSHEQIFLLSKQPTYFCDMAAISEDVAASSLERWGGPVGRKAPGAAPERNDFDANHRGETTCGIAENGKRNKRSVWTVATQPFKEAHFATFPPDLIIDCIKAGCPEGGTVLDPFGGAGTTGLVADRLQRDAILIELNPAYAAMAEDRIRSDGPLFADLSTTEGIA